VYQIIDKSIVFTLQYGTHCALCGRYRLWAGRGREGSTTMLVAIVSS